MAARRRRRERTNVVEQVFLDANILFSAAYLPLSGINRLWRLPQVRLMTSGYALAEARRNLSVARPTAVAKLELLIRSVQVSLAPEAELPSSLELDLKDRPILAAAIAANANVLLTGDRRHFGHLYGKTIAGVEIQRPAEFVRRRETA